MSRESKLVKNTMIIAIGNMCTKCISFLMLPLYTSILSTAEYGTVDMIGTYSALFVIVLSLQFEQGVFRYLVDVRNSRDKQSKYITVSIIVCTIILVIFNIVAISIFNFFNYKYTFYFVVMTTLNTFNAIIMQIPRGLGNNTIYAIASCLNGSLNVILNVVFVALLGWKIEGMLCASILSAAVSLSYVIVKIKLWTYIKWEWESKKYFVELIKYSFPLIPYTLCWWIIGVSDRVLIGCFLGVAFNGIYAAANKFPTLFSMVTNIFQIAWTESAAENVDTEDREKYYNNVFEKTIKFYSSSNLVIVASMPFLFSFMLGEAFQEAYYYIAILLIAAMFHSIAALYGSVYFAFKRTKEISRTTLLAAVVNFVVNIAFIKYIGLYAAAISTLLSYFTITIVRHYDVKKMVEIKIEKKYLLQEILVYILVLSSYYIKNNLLSGSILLYGCVHFVVRNKELLLSLIKSVKNIRIIK